MLIPVKRGVLVALAPSFSIRKTLFCVVFRRYFTDVSWMISGPHRIVRQGSECGDGISDSFGKSGYCD
jgi:hypothetical protein